MPISYGKKDVDSSSQLKQCFSSLPDERPHPKPTLQVPPGGLRRRLQRARQQVKELLLGHQSLHMSNYSGVRVSDYGGPGLEPPLGPELFFLLLSFIRGVTFIRSL